MHYSLQTHDFDSLVSMTLVQLRHFLSLAETASFTQSAKGLFLTQPALSRSIRALEDELGQPLIDRAGRRSELTPFGHDMVERARQLVNDADDLLAAGGRKRGGRSSSLRVGMGPGPGALLAVPLLKRMATPDAQVRIDIMRSDPDRLVDGLRRRVLDAVVVEIRSVVPSPDLRIERLADMHGAFMCRPGHPLTARHRPLAFKDLRRYPMVSTAIAHDAVRAMVDTYGPGGHPDEWVGLRSSELSHLIDLALTSDAVLFAVRAVAPALVKLPVRPAFPTPATFGLITLAGRSEAQAIQLLRELIAQKLRD